MVFVNCLVHDNSLFFSRATRGTHVGSRGCHVDNSGTDT